MSEFGSNWFTSILYEETPEEQNPDQISAEFQKLIAKLAYGPIPCSLPHDIEKELEKD